jgi:hypothetical protein
MTRISNILWCVVAILLAPDLAGAGPLQRYTLIVGANSGGGDRPQLHYAVSDAERVAGVLTELGGVDRDNEIVLRDPTVRGFIDALTQLSARVAAGRQAVTQAGGRTEVVFYYSGHADEKGLLLGEDRVSYQTLRDRLDDIPADVRIAVLDACASGAFTRIKGGRKRPPFFVSPSAGMQGHAFLTSSSATEAAQESDRIRASYFTHYLVSGFRGAADMSGDGQVTLNEAYQFAFTETLGRTVDSKGGVQHPSYDINLTGAGDVVMTDVRQTTATLVLDEELEGRFFIRTAQALVVELYKPKGRRIELALEPGQYEVRVEVEKAALIARAHVSDGARTVLGAREFGAVALETTRRRGDDDVGRFAVRGRRRLAATVGGWGSQGEVLHGVFGSDFDLISGIQYTNYLRENLAITFEMQGFGAEGNIGILGGFSTPLSVRWNPRPGDLTSQRLKPFVTAGVVPVTRLEASDYAIGLKAGAGADVHVTRSFTLGLDLSYNGFPFGGNNQRHDSFRGVELAFGFGWVFGQVQRGTQ